MASQGIIFPFVSSQTEKFYSFCLIFRMNTSLPIYDLRRLNWSMTLLINLFILVMLAVSRVESTKFIIITFFRGMVVIYLLGLVNILTIHFLRKTYEHSVKEANRRRFLLSTVFGLILYTTLVVLFSYLQGNEHELYNLRAILQQFFAFVVLNTLIILLQNQILLQHSKAHADLEVMQLKAAVSEASNLLLRQQIHPHFLFNSLTILKSLYRKDTDEGEMYLTKLATFLRASISEHSSKISLLNSELTLCTDYMQMQKIRFGRAIEYDVTVSEQAGNKFVPFFAVQILLENAIKHNTMTEASPLKIDISDSGNHLTVKNNLQLRSNQEVSTGIGLANLAERYRLLSADQINIKQSEDSFSVTIKLYENENCDY